jgi:uncharacterized membrane protein YphA (DoxX/SURF4 family)
MIVHGFLLARLCIAAVFLFSGADKLRHWRATIEEVKGYGLPWPRLWAALTITTQLAGGLMVAAGLAAWLGALLLSAFTVAATLLGHRFWLRRGNQFRRELTTVLEHLAIVGGLLLIVLLDLRVSVA